MSRLSEMLGPLPDKTPFERGREHGLKGQPGPSFPTPDSDWSSRLYARGWSIGNEMRCAHDE